MVVAQEPFDADANALLFMRRVRWFGAAFCVLQFWLYRPPVGVTVPFDQLRAGILISLALVVANIAITLAGKRMRGSRRRLVVASLLFDAGVIVLVTSLFRFDHASAVWALLLVPVLEAAVAAQMVGAIAMWASLTTLYVFGQLDAAARYAGVVVEIESVSFRAGIMLMVAATAGSLARGLTREAVVQQVTSAGLQRRAALLHGLAVSSQAMFDAQSTDDAEAVWDALLRCAIDAGFQAGSVGVVVDGEPKYRVACALGLPEGFVGARLDSRAGLVGRVLAEGGTVVVEDYRTWAFAVPTLRSAHFGAAAGVPIRRRDGGISAVLVASRREPGALSEAAMECLELLAMHASVALNNVAQIEERERLETRLTTLAYQDSLTGLPNRPVFLQRLAAARSATDVAVLFFDVDRFKTVNDSLGHRGGDEVLQAIAQRISACVGEADLLARLSGDEFALLLVDTDDAAVEQLLANILAALAVPLSITGTEVVVSASIGVASTSSETCPDPAELLARADTAMYAAKRSGAAQYRWFGPDLEQDAARRLRLSTDLQGALARGEFAVHYQPILELEQRRLVGVEALLRWHHPDLGPISPDEFIPLAEETGRIVQIGGWVLEEAAGQLARWDAAFPRTRLHLGVNFSACQLADPGLLNHINAVMFRFGLGMHRLVFEITESVMVEDVEQNASILDALHDRGVKIAVDDFGTGYSSLSYLQRFPVDVLKIDRSFVAQVATGGRTAGLAEAIVQLAATLQLDVCAEGIEDPGQLQSLMRFGCTYGQGYLLGRPGPAAVVTAALNETELQVERVAV